MSNHMVDGLCNSRIDFERDTQHVQEPKGPSVGEDQFEGDSRSCWIGGAKGQNSASGADFPLTLDGGQDSRGEACGHTECDAVNGAAVP